MRATHLLEARDVRVHIRGVRALDGVDLTLRQGEVLGLIGPNGAGKTTLVNVLSGFQAATTGTVALGGRDVTNWPAPAIARAGLVRTFQEARPFAGLTAFENVEVAAVAAVAAGASRRRARVLASGLLARLGLDERARARAADLSHGEERLLAVARAWASRPRVVILDEPAAGLDERGAEALVAFLAGARDALGVGVIVIEHDMRVIMRLSDRIQVLDHGTTVAVGPPGEIRRHPAVLTVYLGLPGPAGA